MAAHIKLACLTLICVSLTLGAPILPEPDIDPVPLKNNKNLFPKKYQSIPLKKFRATTEEPNLEAVTTSAVTNTETVSENEDVSENTTEAMEEFVLTESQEEMVKAIGRTRKSASTTFCVEVRPGNPYQKPFQVCQPDTYHPHPPKPYYPAYQPTYPHPQPQPRPQAHPQPPADPSYSSPVMMLPHVPVAEPYHVPRPAAPPAAGYKPPGAGSGVYRVTEGGLLAEDAAWDAVGARSAYEGGYGYEEEKTPLFDFHKKKELTYVPFITHSVSKTKPFKVLKLLKDLKKDKFEPYENYRPIYSPPHHYEPDYHHESSGYAHKDSGSSSHGLVITCQPSAVGYTGQQNQQELAKHMDLLKNIYQQSEKLYNQQQLSSGPEYSGGGYVSPGTYRNAQEWRGKSSGGSQMQPDATLRSPHSGGENWQQNNLAEKLTPASSTDLTGPNPTLGMAAPAQVQTQNQKDAMVQAFRAAQLLNQNQAN